MQVYDISAEDGAKPSFEFVQSAQYWEVPIAGQGQPENPVPAADGTTYQVHSHSQVTLAGHNHNHNHNHNLNHNHNHSLYPAHTHTGHTHSYSSQVTITIMPTITLTSTLTLKPTGEAAVMIAPTGKVTVARDVTVSPGTTTMSTS